jgi:flagellar biosynthesis/type III secretory pathway protein FliH
MTPTGEEHPTVTRHAPRPAALPHLMTAQEWDEHVTWLMYEDGRRAGYAEGFRAGYAASERDTAEAWRPLAERIRRYAGQKTWQQILDHRAESERAAIQRASAAGSERGAA